MTNNKACPPRNETKPLAKKWTPLCSPLWARCHFKATLHSVGRGPARCRVAIRWRLIKERQIGTTRTSAALRARSDHDNTRVDKHATRPTSAAISCAAVHTIFVDVSGTLKKSPFFSCVRLTSSDKNMSYMLLLKYCAFAKRWLDRVLMIFHFYRHTYYYWLLAKNSEKE